MTGYLLDTNLLMALLWPSHAMPDSLYSYSPARIHFCRLASRAFAAFRDETR